jgi:hypothetical protein
VADVRIPDSIMPGETVKIDYEIRDESQADVVIHALKQAIWADPRFDYQGSKIITVGSLELGRDIRQLSIYATLRKTRRETREPITYASLSMFDAYMSASGIVFGQMIRHIGTTIVAVAEWGKEMLESLPETSRNLSLAVLLIAAVIAYAWFVGLPKRSH